MTQATLGRRARRRIRRACEMGISQFRGGWHRQADNAHIKFKDIGPHKGKQLLFHERSKETKLLAVAHLDCVIYSKCTVTDSTIYTPQLDDRLGAYIILDLLPMFGFFDYDILLTTDEEIGASTASEFRTTKQYNWVFEFDRYGKDDVALYQFGDAKTDRLIEENTNMMASVGSFTDICEFSDLGCKAFNWACGYHNHHTTNCFAHIKDVLYCVNEFLDFAGKFKDVHLPHRKEDEAYSGAISSWYRGSDYDSHDSYQNWKDSISKETCDMCSRDLDWNWNYCPYCGAESPTVTRLCEQWHSKIKR
jgi:hypothetical protein